MKTADEIFLEYNTHGFDCKCGCQDGGSRTRAAMWKYAKQQAADFLDWRQDVRRFNKDLIRNNPNITSAELYDEYLKTIK